MRKDSLAPYRAKRDFSLTEEPSGKAAVAAGKALRFVVQRHDATRLHYDFRLELDGIFKSWAVTQGPVARSDGQAAGGRGRGPSARLRRLRGHHSRRPVWRRHGAALGSRLLAARRRPARGAETRRPEIRARRRAAARQLGAGAHEMGSQRRQADQLAADQASRPGRARGRRGRAPGGSQVGRLGTDPEGDRARQGARADALHDRQEARGRRGVGEQQGGRRREGHDLAEQGQDPQGRGDARVRRAAALRSWSSARRPRRAGRTRSSSTAIACSCGSRTARPRCARARGWTGRRSSPPSPSRRRDCPIA